MNDRNISLYVVQNTNESQPHSFTVTIREGEELAMLVFENGNKGWQFIPQEIPQWIIEIEAPLIKQIESKVAQGRTF